MKNLIQQIDGMTIHETVRFIATLNKNERKEIQDEINERYADVGLNESKIIMNEDYIEGYSGNGFYTLDEENYEDRTLKIIFEQ